MTGSTNQAWAVRMIGRIVRLYPSAVRGPFGAELREVTVARWEAASRRGRLAATRWWITEGVALVWGAVRERWERWAGLNPLRPRGRGNHRPRRPFRALAQDLRWLGRDMRRHASFTLALVAVLGLALGLATSVFAFTDGVLLKPLRYADSDRLVAVWASRPAEGLDRVPLTQWDIQKVLERSSVFESVGGFTQQRSAMQRDEGAIEIGFGWLTNDVHDVLQVQPILGRMFTREDRGELVVLLDHGFWLREFGGDPDVLGTTIRIAQQAWTVVGILPPDTPFELPAPGRVPQRTDVWSTMFVEGSDPDGYSAWIRTVARLAPGVGVEDARAALAQITDAALVRFPERAEAGFQLTADPLRADFTGAISRTLWVLFAATLVLLLAATTNAGNLVVLHHERRRARSAIRLALGASRARLAATAWLEAVLVVLLASVLALPLSRAILTGLLAWTPRDVPRLDSVGLDGRAIVFLGLAAAGAILALGGLATLWTRTVALDDVIRHRRGTTKPWAGGRLVSAEVAFAVPLIVVAVLLGRSAMAAAEVDVGFDPDNAATLRLALPNHEISREELSLILDDFHESLRGLPGVERVGAANLVPLGGGAFTGPVAEGLSALEDRDALEADYRFVTPDYLEALGVELLAGALPRRGDADATVVVDQVLADRMWGSRPAVGQTLAARPLGDARDDFSVIGVVSNTRHESIRDPGRPTVYFTSARYTLPYVTTVVRGRVAAASLFGPARAFGSAAHPDFLVAEARDLGELVGSANALSRWLMVIVAALALGASCITAIGLYAVVGQYVSSQKPSLGIRRALGAQSADVVGLVARRVLVIVSFGCALGVVLAVAASIYLRGELIRVSAADPVTWLGAALLVAALAVGAVLLPTRGAITVSPLEVLRSE